MEAPDISFAQSTEASIAYQVFGRGPLELVFIMTGATSHLEVLWEEPRAVRVYERLARFARVVSFDRRGTGLSDPPGATLTLEQQAEDLLAVVDAVGFERPAFLGNTESARLAVFAAATYPDRFSALALVGSSVTGVSHWDADRVSMFEHLIRTGWGTGQIVALYAPSLAHDVRFMRWAGRLERNSASPGMARRLMRLSVAMDLRELLPSVRVPTLVIHRREDSLVPIERGREVAAAIAGARFVELEGRDNSMIAGDADAVLDEVEEFLTGERPVGESDSFLATVLFTDMVDSTRRAAELGNRDWTDLIDAHDRTVRATLTRYRGEEIKTLGDGFMAAFDGPARAIRCAHEIQHALEQIGITSRAGLHTGEVKHGASDLHGLAVHIAARIAALAGPQEVLVSSTVRELVVGSGLDFEERGSHELKGVPGTWQVLRLIA